MSVVHIVLRLRGGDNTEVIEDEESEDEKKSEDEKESEDEESEDEESEDEESGNMGDRDGRNISMEHLSNFNKCSLM